MTATATKPTGRPAYIDVLCPTDKQLQFLRESLVYLKGDLITCVESVDRDHHQGEPDVEDWLNIAQVFAAVSELIFHIEDGIRRAKAVAMLTEAPAPAEKKATRRKPTTAATNARRFDFSKLPPRVEAGC